MQPMNLTQHQAGFKYPKLNMGNDHKAHIHPGEHLQGKVVDVEHVTFPARGNMPEQRATVVAFQVSYAKINTGLANGTFCVVLNRQMRDAFITAQYGVNDYFGIQYEGKVASKANPGQSYHSYTIEGQKTPESKFVADVQVMATAPQTNAAPATTTATPPVPPAPPATSAPVAPSAPPVPPSTSAPPVPPGGFQHQQNAPAAPPAPAPAPGTPSMPTY